MFVAARLSGSLASVALVIVLVGALGLTAVMVADRRQSPRRTERAHDMRSDRTAAAARSQLDVLRIELAREFVATLRAALAVPPHSPIVEEVPLLFEQLEIAARGTDRLLGMLVAVSLNDRTRQDCVAAARAVGAALVDLQMVLAHPLRNDSITSGTSQAVRQVHGCVDRLSAAVTAAVSR